MAKVFLKAAHTTEENYLGFGFSGGPPQAILNGSSSAVNFLKEHFLLLYVIVVLQTCLLDPAQFSLTDS